MMNGLHMFRSTYYLYMFSRLRPKTFPLDTHKRPALVPAAHRRLNIHCYSYTRLKQRKSCFS